MGKVKYLIIQPHSDDALFSASHQVLSSHDVTVLTVEHNAKRCEEDKKLYEFLGHPWHHLNVEFDDQSYYGYKKQNDTLNVELGRAYLGEFFGYSVLQDVEKELTDFIKKFVKTAKKKGKKAVVYVPLGVGHPFHIFVRDVVENCEDDFELRFYRDFPHSYKRRSQKQMKDEIAANYELCKSYDITESADVKWELAKKFYKTQSGLLWFEQGYIKKNLPEEVYVKK